MANSKDPRPNDDAELPESALEMVAGGVSLVINITFNGEDGSNGLGGKYES